jgi:NADH-quinone oxidoreductase subunit M
MARLIAFLLVLLLPAATLAAGRIEVPRVPLELERVPMAQRGEYEAVFDVRNPSDEPLQVSRIAPRTDTDDVRLPRQLAARFVSGQTSGTIAPHGSAKVRVSWTDVPNGHARSFFGHVMITSTDETAGEVAVGIAVHTSRLGVLGRHLLSLLVALPLAASALLGAVFLAGLGGVGRRPRVVALAVSLACAALAIVAWATFDPDLVRADGGEGFQHVERSVLLRGLGVEMFLGVDGASLPLVVLCALAAPCGVLLSWDKRKSPSMFFATYMLLAGASLGAIVALDAVVYLTCLALALAAAFLLVGLHARTNPRDPPPAVTASRMLVACGLGLLLVAVAVAGLHGTTARTFLVDGSPVMHTWAFPELARVDFAGALAKRALVLSVIGLGLVGGIFPGHVWLAPLLRASPPAVSLMVCVGLTRAALLGLLRVDAAALPDALRWAAPTLGALGAAGALYAALVAIAQRDLAGVVSFALVCASGTALAGIASLTPQALLGASTGIAMSGCAAGAAMLTLGALRTRTTTLDIRDVRGIGLEAPILATALGLAALGTGAMPGTASFWTTWLVGLGAVVREPGIAIAVLVAAVLLAASQTMPMLRIVRGRLPDALRRGEPLIPFGGHVPDLRPRELAAVGPLLLLVVLLGFYPVPLIAHAQATVRDLNELVNPPGPTHIE